MSTATLTPMSPEPSQIPADAGRRLNYRHLAAVHAVARAGGLTRAAEALALAPPTLSAQIREFEKTLGMPLFDRVRGGLTPTEVGEIAIDYAERIFATGCELLDAVEQHAARGPAVGVDAQVPASLAAHWVEAMVAREPAARVVLSEIDPADAERSLASGEVDVVLTTRATPIGEDGPMAAESLGDCGLGFFAHAQHAAELSADFPKCLDGTPFLGTSDDAAIDAWLKTQGVRRRVVAIADSLEVRRSLALEGRGVFAAPAVLSHSLCARGDFRWLGTAHAIRTQFTAVAISDRYGPGFLSQVASGTRQRVVRADDDRDEEVPSPGRSHDALASTTEVSR
ncbi:MAG: LysR family transcriptional regulator [bacterium]|nr:LysR family transcriptional regulator [bacterium]